jgi:sec-independent protein translocase protein TatC
MPTNDRPIPVADHISELRKRAIISLAALIICSVAAIPLVDDLVRLLTNYAHMFPGGDVSIITIGPFEGWSVYTKVAIIAGAVLSSPVWLYEIFAFIRPAIAVGSSRMIMFGFGVAMAFFMFGAVFCYRYILPQAIRLGIAINDELGASMFLQLGNFISIALGLMIAFGLAFELPLITAILVRTGLIRYEQVKSIRPYVIVAAFIVGAILTPPDVISQLALSIPLILLFETGLIVGRIWLARSKATKGTKTWQEN